MAYYSSCCVSNVVRRRTAVPTNSEIPPYLHKTISIFCICFSRCRSIPNKTMSELCRELPFSLEINDVM